MILLTTFAISVLVGDLIAIGICAIVERFSEMGSLVLFLMLFVAVIPIAWRSAVHLTEPAGPLSRIWK